MTLRLGFVALALLACQGRDVAPNLPREAYPAYNRAAAFANGIGPMDINVLECHAVATDVMCSALLRLEPVAFRCSASACGWVNP